MNSGRHESRMWAVQFLFQRDFNHGDIAEALDDFWLERKAGPALRKFAEELIHGVEAHKTEIDELIQKYAEHWNVSRMGAVDRNVMRVAIYEMLHRTDIPPVVSINEAVELAKELSGDDSGKFVNGILDRASKSAGRPARTVRPVNAPSSLSGEQGT
ncbi:MAG TPA: transcription antitermination factor NusB [Kiritimatiellia bacterium]|nr:transcription antitermination factor NusB [Kiritimatiellia bacterium]